MGYRGVVFDNRIFQNIVTAVIVKFEEFFQS